MASASSRITSLNPFLGEQRHVGVSSASFHTRLSLHLHTWATSSPSLSDPMKADTCFHTCLSSFHPLEVTRNSLPELSLPDSILHQLLACGAGLEPRDMSRSSTNVPRATHTPKPVYSCVCVCVCQCHITSQIWRRAENDLRESVLPFLMWVLGTELGHQAWWQVL